MFSYIIFIFFFCQTLFETIATKKMTANNKIIFLDVYNASFLNFASVHIGEISYSKICSTHKKVIVKK